MIKNNVFCNNCGKQGHIFHSCKLPIISNGLIVYRDKQENDKQHNSLNNNLSFDVLNEIDKSNKYDKYEYLMIKRKDTLGYVDFLRGRYSLHNKLYLSNIIDEMTLQEKENLMLLDFETLWTNLWLGTSSSQYKNEGKISKEKFEKLKKGIYINKKFVSIKILIQESSTKWEETEWGFPKGRRNYNEKDISCAIREFEEETGYTNDDLDVLYNIIPYEEIFTGSNFKSYKHKYYVCKLKNNVKNTKGYQKSEVSDLKWKDYTDCINSIRPYNVEKKEIITKVNNVLNKYLVL